MTQYAVCVAPHVRRSLCSGGAIWVKDATHRSYVCKKERGLWNTKEEAKRAITELFEIVVEVKDE